MSLHSPSLKAILPLCPDDVRVMAWVKPMCSFKPNVAPAYAWEPVIVKPVRKPDVAFGTPRDWIAANMATGQGLRGSKPSKFCYWLFQVLGAEWEDEFTDLFPGSGIVSRSWEAYRSQFALLRAGA